MLEARFKLPARSRPRASQPQQAQQRQQTLLPRLTPTSPSGFARVKRRCWRSHGSVTPVQPIEARSSRKMAAEQAGMYLSAAGGDKGKDVATPRVRMGGNFSFYTFFARR